MECCKNLAERMEEEVLDKYKVEESKRGALKGRGNFLEWKKVRRNKRYKIRKWREDCRERIFSLLRESTSCSVCKASRRSPQKRRR